MSPAGPNEAATRAQLIDNQLASAGWNATGEDLEAEYRVESRGSAGQGFVDYALRGEDGRVVGIVEAKRSSRDPIVGKEQARLYADAIEQQQGLRPVIFLANGYRILYSDGIGDARQVGAFFSPEDIARRLFQRENRSRLAAVEINSKIVNRPYQLEALRRAHETLDEGKRRLLWVMATGTGKTRTAAAFVDTVIRARWAQRVLFVVDRNTLATQALDAFREFLPGEPAEQIRTSTYDNSKRIYVATLQTMQDFYQEFTAGAFDIIVIDECHRSIYHKWKSVLTYFDAYLVGLTATPADFIDRNTFDFFGCQDRLPTFAYDLEQAVEDKNLVPYEAYHARTQIQIEGIHGSELPPQVKAQLEEEGIDPDDLNFEGTQLERRVTNRETTRLIVREFFDNALADPSGSLPGKSIIFAISHKHAVRLLEIFNEMYPQHIGLAEVIDSHMEDTESLIRRFKRDPFPRIAISVDMLDTGVDVPTVVNLGFLKPVFSRIKFWQMIGRGTRVVSETNAKEWCPADAKKVFRILDFWDNFNRFQLDPEGVEPSASTPVAVRKFRLLLQAVVGARQVGRPDLEETLISELRGMVDSLPMESPLVRAEGELIEQVARENYWLQLTPQKLQTLKLEFAPLMRFLPRVDVARETYSNHCLSAIVAILDEDDDKIERAQEKMLDDLRHLPVDHPDLEREKAFLIDVHRERISPPRTPDEVWTLRSRFERFMRLREPEPQHLITLDLDDVFEQRDWIVVGPESREFDLDDYRREVEDRVRMLAQTHPAMLRLATGQQLTDQDLMSIEAVLDEPELYITESTLRRTYSAPHGSFTTLLRHALKVEKLPSREEAINDAVAALTHSRNLTADQILFVRLFARRLIQVGRVERQDLYEVPFSRLGGDVEQKLSPNDLEELLALNSMFGM
ncbi:type I restriction enzyme R subunit [Krasilnikovia cinnamomea]|uniref:Type I restriction enzyme R subunit n=1 Tax=Krasilnikovia cinnamomea TaxID=349313 RepID=A0A4V2G6T9_9ACTN|nr:type I restriction endonuclease subunit R [Krasilnikovia cinnamomea]RZU49966.1 type I restriction enzyme R subunit [Krasilnikovia cinnamomea]